jgi:hypothetical protein
MKVISDFNYLELRRSTNGCLTTEARESISITNLSCLYPDKTGTTGIFLFLWLSWKFVIMHYDD